jgi:hypothetical protein
MDGAGFSRRIAWRRNDGYGVFLARPKTASFEEGADGIRRASATKCRARSTLAPTDGADARDHRYAVAGGVPIRLIAKEMGVLPGAVRTFLLVRHLYFEDDEPYVRWCKGKPGLPVHAEQVALAMLAMDFPQLRRPYVRAALDAVDPPDVCGARGARTSMDPGGVGCLGGGGVRGCSRPFPLHCRARIARVSKRYQKTRATGSRGGGVGRRTRCSDRSGPHRRRAGERAVAVTASR